MTNAQQLCVIELYSRAEGVRRPGATKPLVMRIKTKHWSFGAYFPLFYCATSLAVCLSRSFVGGFLSTAHDPHTRRPDERIVFTS